MLCVVNYKCRTHLRPGPDALAHTVALAHRCYASLTSILDCTAAGMVGAAATHVPGIVLILLCMEPHLCRINQSLPGHKWPRLVNGQALCFELTHRE
jgi:hypothetical protein